MSTEYIATYVDWGAGYLGKVIHFDGATEVQDWISHLPETKASDALAVAKEWIAWSQPNCEP